MESGISRSFRNSRQEDAHEYMVNLLESMHKCCLPSGVPSESPIAYDKSLVHKIFGGRLRSQVTVVAVYGSLTCKIKRSKTQNFIFGNMVRFVNCFHGRSCLQYSEIIFFGFFVVIPCLLVF